MFETRNTSPVVIAIVALTLWGNACGSAQGPTSPGTTSAPTTTATAMSSLVSTSEITIAMERAIQDEYHAEAVYKRVLADFGEVWPFSNIVQAEARHAAAVAGLFTKRGLEIPASQWNLDNVPRFNSVAEACAAAAQAERDNIALYDEFLKMTLPRDVDNVFTNNRRASLQAHLPAFETCAGR
jgi:hypothetical protein